MTKNKNVLMTLCVAFVACLAGCKKAEPIYLEADTGQIGSGAILFLEKTTGTGTLMMKATSDYPQGFNKNVKITDKVGTTTAPVWTLVTEDGKNSLVFAPSATGWTCQSCPDNKLPLNWHIKARSN